MKLTSMKKYLAPGRIASAEIKMTNIGDAESVKESAVVEKVVDTSRPLLTSAPLPPLSILPLTSTGFTCPECGNVGAGCRLGDCMFLA